MIHAHAILTMLRDESKAYTRESLKRAVLERFGKKAKFTNCSGRPFSFDSILNFSFPEKKSSSIPTEVYLSSFITSVNFILESKRAYSFAVSPF